MGDPIDYPEDKDFLPLNNFKGVKLLSYSTIEEWFLPRKSKKGMEKGRILAIKLFVKYTKVCKKADLYFVKARCCAEQKKTGEYIVQIIIETTKIVQCSCTCPAGAGLSVSCKHVGAVCFSLEYFSVTGRC